MLLHVALYLLQVIKILMSVFTKCMPSSCMIIDCWCI